MNSSKNKRAFAAVILFLFAMSAYGLKITCESMAVSDNADANLANIKTLLGEAQGELVIFPELALCNAASGKEQAWVDSAVTDLRALCLSQKKAVIFGVARKSGGLTYNSAYYINASGVLAGTYDQIHAKPPYSPGMKVPIFPLTTTEGLVRFGIHIGTDLSVPEPWQFFAENGVRCMLLVYISGLKGAQAWDKSAHNDLLMCHATDNSTFAAGASAAAPDALVKSQVLNGAGSVLFEHDPASPGKVEAQISFLTPGFIMFWRHDEWRRDLYQLVIKTPAAAENRRMETAEPGIRIFPNPFRNQVRVEVKGILSAADQAEIFDIRGRCVADLSQELCKVRAMAWRAGSLPSGVYLLKATLGTSRISRKLLLQR